MSLEEPYVFKVRLTHTVTKGWVPVAVLMRKESTTCLDGVQVFTQMRLRSKTTDLYDS